MLKILHKIILSALILLSAGAFSQQQRQNRADELFNRFAYIDAINIYENLVGKGFKSIGLFQQLGDAYYFNGELQKANKAYSFLFGLTNEVPSEYYYRYAQTLKSLKSYNEADRYLKLFAEKEVTDQRARWTVEAKDYLKHIEENSGRYELSSLKINSEYSDYGSAIYENKLVFTSARDTGRIAKRIHTWTNNPFTSLYEAEISVDGSIGKVKKFAKAITSKFNESTPVFTADGNTMYFTRNNYNKGIRGKDISGTTLLKIYRAIKVDGKWGKAEELSFNGDNFSTAHPALTPDGKWLYFASNRQGGQGNSDLYKVEILAYGNFGSPINLGSAINTGGRETFPFITQNNELYFSSDGHPGLGGLDIFGVKILEDGKFGKIKNIGTPANSESDDFAFMINSTTKKGFLSSNRANGVGKDDIYSIFETRELDLDCLQTIKGVVYDKESNEKLRNTKVSLFDNSFKFINEAITDDLGRYEFTHLNCGLKYRVNASLEDYNTAEVTVDLPFREGSVLVDFGLEKTRIIVEKGDDLFKVLKLLPIYFDFDKSDIRSDATMELAKVVAVLEQYPSMKIDIRSHTDSRGNDNYNLQLSDRRAKSTRAWLISQGISGSRLFAKGYGETQLINGCENGVKCTDEQHQDNRRSEFIVLEL
ncbi:OmpA family protein [Flavobacterium sp. NKUCC04_CG]|uniref:OmpA family protein n=1 Tax=Flavobacterium sp. NKUCC04_CG TaxID=2842121 RepID=UPI001C5AAF59|nr:OmpA family protein [Flavobacterium sp. NKUCC04_CG]MBW3520162.1 OmpA family protein [Flavobacterium sp. NKUCC04_CG]